MANSTKTEQAREGHTTEKAGRYWDRGNSPNASAPLPFPPLHAAAGL